MFVDQKYNTWDTLGAKKQKGDYKDQEPNLRFFWSLNERMGKTCFGGAFDQLLVFVDQKYNTWDTFEAKTKKAYYKDPKPNLRSIRC